jgi:hypothetical protein
MYRESILLVKLSKIAASKVQSIRVLEYKNSHREDLFKSILNEDMSSSVVQSVVKARKYTYLSFLYTSQRLLLLITL